MLRRRRERPWSIWPVVVINDCTGDVAWTAALTSSRSRRRLAAVVIQRRAVWRYYLFPDLPPPVQDNCAIKCVTSNTRINTHGRLNTHRAKSSTYIRLHASINAQTYAHIHIHTHTHKQIQTSTRNVTPIHTLHSAHIYTHVRTNARNQHAFGDVRFATHRVHRGVLTKPHSVPPPNYLPSPETAPGGRSPPSCMKNLRRRAGTFPGKQNARWRLAFLKAEPAPHVSSSSCK